MNRTIKLQCEAAEIQVNEVDGIYTIESSLLTDLHEEQERFNEPDDPELEAVLKAVETVILAHAAAGVKVGAKAYGEGINNALESIVVNL
jgi:hypothetical protein